MKGLFMWINQLNAFSVNFILNWIKVPKLILEENKYWDKHSSAYANLAFKNVLKFLMI